MLLHKQMLQVVNFQETFLVNVSMIDLQNKLHKYVINSIIFSSRYVFVYVLEFWKWWQEILNKIELSNANWQINKRNYLSALAQLTFSRHRIYLELMNFSFDDDSRKSCVPWLLLNIHWKLIGKLLFFLCKIENNIFSFPTTVSN